MLTGMGCTSLLGVSLCWACLWLASHLCEVPYRHSIRFGRMAEINKYVVLWPVAQYMYSAPLLYAPFFEQAEDEAQAWP
jgi:hypothetical protein